MPVIAAVVLGGTGLGLQVKAQHEAGKAAERQAESEAAWSEYNAKVQERAATEEQTAAAFEERKQRKAGERLKARQRAVLGKAGVLPEGSPLDVLEETATELEIDALLIRRGGQVGAQQLRSGAQLSRMTGRSAIMRGRAAKRAGRLGAFATGVSGGSQLAFRAAEFKKGP